ncbi:lysylphosphatidylglycerol synthase domain-containing protein [Rhodanobacter sp. MP7CTX1]|jgi:glycosyltransferase 2 family protein|uniref:lysylphosphatidylglycerol synthase domain-containing protein n=1 Tax=Rhodanobacter sp. MP7CTX1 TaxID=2723084 RepID=UPI00161E59C7|nr:lysylphosphatidylglycerol synthase domain-containing protein [Rhodanobacter sp. MP7CTX1]MBB6187262.1 hypothetical protein [Rhodanobacter sp. MP7CTX1]
MSTPFSRFLLGRPVRLALTSVAIGALLFASWRYRVSIADILAKANLWLLGLSTMLALLANYLTGLPFNNFLKQFGINVPNWKTCYLQLVVQVTKYVPGNVWGAILQAQLLDSSRIGAIFLAGIDTSVFYMMTLSTTGLALLVYSHHPLAAGLIAVTGWLISARVASSAWLARSVGWIARLLGRTLHIVLSKPTTGEIGRLFTWAMLHAIAQAGSVIILLIAVTHYTAGDILIGTASICLAWVVGTMAIIIPSGLGVREFAFVALATMFHVSADTQSLAAIAIVARVAQTLPDIFAAVIVAGTEIIRPTQASSIDIR